MAFTPEQEKALLALLNNKKITLTELPPATEINNDDLLLTRQGIKDKSITSGLLQAHYNKDVLQKSKHLADVANKATARKNLELGTAAQRDVGGSLGEVMTVGISPIAPDDYNRDFYSIVGRNESFTVNGAWKNGPPGYDSHGGHASVYHRVYETGSGRILHFMALSNPTSFRWHNWYLVSGKDNKDTEWIHKWVKNLDSENATAADIGAYPVTGGLVSGFIDSSGIITSLADFIQLRNDKRAHFAIRDADYRMRMAIYKDKGGDGVHLNNGYDGGGDWVFNKNGQLYCPGDIRAGNAVLDVRGNLYGDAWGSLGLWHYLHDVVMPAGIPQPWAGATPPPGWVKCNGWAFDKAKYPKLAVAYPTGVLPDLRGEFIRGWDDGRGGDPGRTLLSWQGDALQRITGGMSIVAGGVAASWGAMHATGEGANHIVAKIQGQDPAMTFDSARVARSSHETRPRNIAFNYIVRAS